MQSIIYTNIKKIKICILNKNINYSNIMYKIMFKYHIFAFIHSKIEKNWFIFICNFSFINAQTYFVVNYDAQKFIRRKRIMRVSSVVTGVAAGMAAGAIVSAMAAGVMSNPSTRRAVKSSAKNMSHAAKKAAHDITSSMS